MKAFQIQVKSIETNEVVGRFEVKETTASFLINGERITREQLQTNTRIVLSKHIVEVKNENVVKHDWPGMWQCMPKNVQERFANYF